MGAKSAATTPNARGFGLHQLLAGRRASGSGPVLTRLQVCENAAKAGLPLQPSTLTRVLNDGKTVSEINLQRIAVGLGVDLEEVRRAYTVTLREHERAKGGGK